MRPSNKTLSQDRNNVTRHVRRAAISGLALAVLPAALMQALAQAPDGDAATLDAIVVTANKRVENVQEVPKQVLVVSSEALGKSGVTTISELGNIIPSIGGMVDPRSSTPPLRGISSFGTTVGVQSQTGVVIDDVPQPAYSSLFKELADIQSVEVLAGPQSTLSGRNASAGLINVRTREPEDYFSAQAFFERTSDRQQRFTAFMTGPLSQTLAFSVSAFANEWEGHLRSPRENSGNRPLHLGGWDTQGVRGKLRWQPSERLTTTLTAYTMESTTLVNGTTSSFAYISVDPSARHRNTGTPGNELTFAQIYPDIKPGRYNTWVGGSGHGSVTTRDHGGTLRVEYELDNGMTLTSISALTKANMPRRDLVLSFPELNAANAAYPWQFNNYITETKSQELRLVSPGGQRFDYVVGAIYSDEDTVFPIQRLGFGPVNWVRSFKLQSAALFARGTVHVSERDDLTVGVRYQDDKMGYGWDFLANVPDATVPDAVAKGDSSYDFFSAELSWRHALSDGVSVYASAARAESGRVYDMGHASRARSTGLTPLDSQEVTNIELGLKSQWLDRRLTVNANIFQANYDNYQIRTRETVIDPNVFPELRLFTIGEVETRGAELETRFRATENLNVNLGAAWVDAKIKDFPNSQCWIRQTRAQGCVPVPGGRPTDTMQVNLAGNQMPHAPKFKVAGTANYFIPLDSRPFDLELTGTYRWQSKTWFDYRGNPNMYQNGYGILNLALSLRDRDDRYALSLFVNNVLDKNFYINMDDDDRWTSPAYFGSYARDSFRYAGVNLRVNF